MLSALPARLRPFVSLSGRTCAVVKKRLNLVVWGASKDAAGSARYFSTELLGRYHAA